MKPSPNATEHPWGILFCERLIAARKYEGWTQVELAKRAGIRQAAVSHFETGRNFPSAVLLRRLCLALRVSANHLLGLPESYPHA